MDVRYPIGKLQVPEKVTLENIEEWLKDIATYTTRLRETVGSLNEEELSKTYRDGSWTVRQLVHHIADSQLNMYQRLKLALTDENPTVPAFDEEKWAILPDTKLPVETSIKMLEGINERILFLGSTLSEDQLDRSFIHQKNGKITVATKVAKLAWHEEHHLAHIQIALEK
ncbi:putative metal-dependent hydrolase [Lysinibacillus irui]|uniref:Metal-dependent hydrolase n=1 Tax=Lysinibacillus irui TaxID=2998077 RepID=A0AAJ5UPZ9_9BACI|nr:MULTISPECIES: putative metal-dependent hydrolase [Lysinibacillus]MEA0553096.1 putative metal-dependent hydrolase [Lysinibacillus irui]MEA0975676.1 putative metal-dependent hydrolase [Lysinibacillus irui]MEA1041830.1 putative metal-dependent hydrolase [Lysinibacillus irui]WDV04901.1 putative metal-dependent hydrolase [Lysinibacillus irui]